MCPRFPEKRHDTEEQAVPKPTQVGGYKHTKARGRNLVKELGGSFRAMPGGAVNGPMRLFNKNIALCQLVKRMYRV